MTNEILLTINNRIKEAVKLIRTAHGDIAANKLEQLSEILDKGQIETKTESVLTVYGYDVSEEEYNKILSEVGDEFTACDMTKSAIDVGIPEYIQQEYKLKRLCSRVTDRVLQREKKLGNIVWTGKFWKKTNNVVGLADYRIKHSGCIKDF